MPKGVHEMITECLHQVIPKIALAHEFAQVVVHNALAQCLIAFVKIKALGNHYSLGLKVTTQSHRMSWSDLLPGTAGAKRSLRREYVGTPMELRDMGT